MYQTSATCAAVVASFLLMTTPSWAQTVTVPTRVAVGCGFIQAGIHTSLTTAFLSGNEATFRAQAQAALTAIEASCPDVQNVRIDLNADAVMLMWVDTDPLGKDDQIYYGLVQKGSEPSSSILHGVGETHRGFEVFISTQLKHAVASAYTSTQQRNPLEEQLPALAKAVTDPLMALLAATQGVLKSAPAPPPAAPPSHYATVSRMVLPFARSIVHVDVRTGFTPDVETIKDDVARLQSKNQFTMAHATCTATLNAELKKIVDAQAPMCAASLRGCRDLVAPLFNSQYTAQLAVCTTEAERKELLGVDASYREFIAGLGGTKLETAFDLKNVPKQVLSLGVMTAFAFKGGVKDATRVTTNDDGNVVADPLGRQMNLVVVNVALKPYDIEAFQPTAAERFRMFAGAVVTPDFGVAGGLSALLVRGLSVNVGGAILGVRGMRDGDTLGQPPQNGADPFKLSPAYVWLVGVGYNFK